MRISIYAAVALGVLSLAACSKQTNDQVKADASDAGDAVKDATQAVANDPNLKDAADTAKVAATNLKDQARDVAADAKVATDKAAENAKVATDKAAAKTKAAAADAKADLKS